MKKQTHLLKLVLSALLLAVAYVLPFFTGQIQKIGNMLCPMHIPVMLCGFLCGWPWGLAVGFLAPLFRSFTLGMPVFFPSAVCMAIELAVYGAVSGWMYRLLPHKKPFLYLSLITAMLVGRIVWGAAMFLCMGAAGEQFTLAAFLTRGFLNAIPGIIAQLILVPLAVLALERSKLLRRQD